MILFIPSDTVIYIACFVESLCVRFIVLAWYTVCKVSGVYFFVVKKKSIKKSRGLHSLCCATVEKPCGLQMWIYKRSFYRTLLSSSAEVQWCLLLPTQASSVKSTVIPYSSHWIVVSVFIKKFTCNRWIINHETINQIRQIDQNTFITIYQASGFASIETNSFCWLLCGNLSEEKNPIAS